MKNMTREKAIQILKQQQNNRDIEDAHGVADEVLLDLLRELGYQDVVEEYFKVEKHYA